MLRSSPERILAACLLAMLALAIAGGRVVAWVG